ncbi:hypothetical protein GCM10009555_084270 [Acrocarpospora macrocephala]|uniref:GAF domain-containing protein n=1 Tax=Acrocarpospora macrocephala TaxID=150177 RepID=A0A5M3WZ02_9ACTN|nr:hypothetical protein [Acrocarpospora macrocephala]GES13542.1 hypothetical protein Amac_071390 [Acrocarpospora macrocephala]
MERILSGHPAGEAVRAPILNSWRRCQAAGLTPGTFQPRLIDDVDCDNTLVRAARPVLDRLQTTIADTPSDVFLCDASGVQLLRIVGDPSMYRGSNAILAVPGFSFAESDVGTNAAGSTLMERRTCQVSGNEHLWEPLRRGTAVGIRVCHPLSGRVEGVVGIVAWHERANAQMIAVARRSADAVEQRLLELSTERERALLRRLRGAARAASGVQASMPRDLGYLDRLALEDAAVRLVAQGQAAVVEIALSDGRTATLVAQPVTDSADLTGIAVQAWLPDRRPTTGPQD